MASHYEVPSWAGKPPSGTHLDVTKEDKLIQKLMIDEKKCYLFGRNAQFCQFTLDHASCSRVHAALVYHKFLNIIYLVDLGSSHGTFIGSVRLEPQKPTQVHVGASFHFGASTRNYILRERPSGTRMIHEEIPMEADGTLLGLPETQSELDNLTEYNTAHNRRIAMITDDAHKKKNQKRKRKMVTFNEEEIIINPEDIDPSVGRFRNLVQTTVLPTSNKRQKIDHFSTSTTSTESQKPFISQQPYVPSLYQGLNTPANEIQTNTVDTNVLAPGAFGSKFLILPNPAPEVTPDLIATSTISKTPIKDEMQKSEMSNEPKKKKYAKEAWPGRKPQFL
uniref:CSON002855 protein n=1 Tax=Culicoides sonorensis TaxID=179676 RepID=A0A336K2M3_CULSO